MFFFNIFIFIFIFIILKLIYFKKNKNIINFYKLFIKKYSNYSNYYEAGHNNTRTHTRFEKINIIPLNTRLRLNQIRPIRDRTRWG